MLNKEEKRRLREYKLALLCYRLSLIFPKSWFDTTDGFCKYFGHKKSLFHYYPELWYANPNRYWTHWFPKGKLKPRIELLKKVINQMEEKNV